MVVEFFEMIDNFLEVFMDHFFMFGCSFNTPC